jgi:hypothetical protein
VKYGFSGFLGFLGFFGFRVRGSWGRGEPRTGEPSNRENLRT